jgi:hypothetical protein
MLSDLRFLQAELICKRTTLLFHITNQDQRATKFSFTTGAEVDCGLGLRICVDRVVPLVVLDVITPLETS